MRRRDIQWIALFLILGGLGLTVFVQYYDRAFPVASLNFRLTRDQAFATAKDYVESLGHSTESYRDAQVFDQSGMQQIFLERTLGLAESNQLVREWLSVWYWHIRWFKPLEKEELRVRLDPDGRIVGFEHRVPESESGARLSQEAARGLAETFLTEVQGFQLANYIPIEASSNERPERIDHTFTYRKKDFTIGDDGHYRLRVIVQGDQIGSFAEFLKVPETFARSYTETRSRADLLTSVATIFWFALGIAMIIVLMRHYRRGTLQWRGGFTIGVVVAVVAFIANLNSYPLVLFSYTTTQSFGFFVTILLVGVVIGSVLYGGLVCLAGTTGGAVARDALFEGRHNPLARFSLRNLRSVSFARSTLVGYGLAFAHLGYITLFYILGAEHLGVWVPAAMKDYSNTYSTLLPWIYPLFIGLIASTMEEFFFRLLAIPLLIQWTGRRWLAVLIPAVVWAFLHSNYPQEPIFIRGLELTVVGVIFGIVFLRYGIWATIISHYVFNAFVGSYPMIQSDNLYFKISGVLVIAIIFIPALPAIFSTLTGRYRETEAETEEPEPQHPEPPPAEPPPKIQTRVKSPQDYCLPKRDYMLAFGVFLVGMALYIAFKTDPFGHTFTLSVTRSDAVQKAEAIRSQLAWETAGHKQTAWFASSLGNAHHAHLIQTVGIDSAETLVASQTHPWVWHVRWFKSLEKEEYRIGIDHRGNLAFLDHRVPENQSGADLSTSEALPIAETIAETHLRRPVTDTTQYKRIEGRAEKRDARTDHHFVWDRIDQKVGDGEFRVAVTLHGDQIGSAGVRYKAPEAFLRDMREQTLKDGIVTTVSALFVIATIILGVVSLLRAYRAGEIRWRPPTGAAILIGACYLLDKLNESVSIYSAYDTQKSLATFWGATGVQTLFPIVFFGLFTLLLMALADARYRKQFPEEMPLTGWFDVLRFKTGSAKLWMHALILAFTWVMLQNGLGSLKMYVQYTWLYEYIQGAGYTPGKLNAYLPFLRGLTRGLSGTAMMPAIGLTLLLIWLAVVRNWRLFIALMLLAGLLVQVLEPAQDLYHFAWLAALFIVSWGARLFLIIRFIRFNLLAYIMTFWLPIVHSGRHYFNNQAPEYQINAVLMILIGFLPLFFTLYARYRERTPTPT